MNNNKIDGCQCARLADRGRHYFFRIGLYPSAINRVRMRLGIFNVGEWPDLHPK